MIALLLPGRTVAQHLLFWTMYLSFNTLILSIIPNPPIWHTKPVVLFGQISLDINYPSVFVRLHILEPMLDSNVGWLELGLLDTNNILFQQFVPFSLS